MPNTLARAFRNKPTSGEAQAWKVLRSLRTHGVHVRRQHPIGRYVVDFAILKERLAIEIDGPFHDAEKERDAVLANLGWCVLRLPAEVAFAPDQLLGAVNKALRDSPSP
jgi:very-short-patch-repair endonuclease